MRNHRRRLHPIIRTVVIAAAVLVAGQALAHDQPGSTDFIMSLPTDYFTGQVLTTMMIGPESGSRILHATLDVTWLVDPNMPASDLGIEFGVPTTGGTLHWIVTGADLGWDGGPGPFSATIDTDSLNGEVFWPLPPNSIVNLDLFTASGSGGVWGQFQNSTLTFEIQGDPTSAGSLPDGARTVLLRPGSPNPFQDRSRISYSLPVPAAARLAIFDVRGREVNTLVSGPQDRGWHEVSWDGRNTAGETVASGVYFVRLESGGKISTKRLVLTR